jgi:ferredoxin-thioredoxin reductase catalytic subunit
MKSIKEIESKLITEAEKTGYILNPDREMLEDIIEGLAVNEERLGYWSCPCRMASGNRLADFDIICPCEYRDPDLKEYGRCYCALYVNQDYIDMGMPTDPIPERRPQGKRSEIDVVKAPQEQPVDDSGGEIKVWRCQVCGYLCARPEPPRLCPICRAKRERFEEFRL